MSPQLSAGEKIFNDRKQYLIEVLIIFFGIFLFNLTTFYLLEIFINSQSDYYGPLLFLTRALSIFIAIPLFLFISSQILPWLKEKVLLKREEINPAISYLKLYGINKNNCKYQLLYGILLLFLVFIPLDFIFYFLIPETISYSHNVLTLGDPGANNYLLNPNYSIFLISTIIIHLSVAFYEESLARGLLAYRGNNYFQRMSAVMISSLYFGLGHFSYMFKIQSWIPILWFFQTFIVGIVLSLFFLRKKWFFPVIFAHAFNNIISSHTIWNYPKDFSFIALTLYTPLLIISLIIFIFQFSRIKAGINTGINDIRKYFKNDKKIGEENSDKYTRIALDILLVAILFVVGFVLV